MEKIYILMLSIGEYDDYFETPIVGSENADKINKLCEELNLHKSKFEQIIPKYKWVYEVFEKKNPRPTEPRSAVIVYKWVDKSEKEYEEYRAKKFKELFPEHLISYFESVEDYNPNFFVMSVDKI